MTTYVARIRHGSIYIHRSGQSDPIAVVTWPPGETSLRKALQEAGWRPSGRYVSGGDCGSLAVERLPTDRDFRPGS